MLRVEHINNYLDKIEQMSKVDPEAAHQDLDHLMCQVIKYVSSTRTRSLPELQQLLRPIVRRTPEIIRGAKWWAHA